MSRFGRSLLLLVAAGFSVACSEPIACIGGVHGIAVDVRQPSGESAVPGAMIVAQDRSYADTVGPIVPNHGRINYEGHVVMVDRGGNYLVTVTKPHWTTATQQVRVPGTECGASETQFVEMLIAMLPGAPSVRSVAVAPRTLQLGDCFSGFELATYVDSDSGTSKEVTWRAANPNVATVTATELSSLVHVAKRQSLRSPRRIRQSPTV